MRTKSCPVRNSLFGKGPGRLASLFTLFSCCLFVPADLSAQSQGTVEDIQIRSINLQTQVLELHNFGNVNRSLTGWRFCTHDEIDGFDYTASGGLNGFSIDPGQSLFVHWLNDAAAANEVNVSALGGQSIADLLATTPSSAISIGIYRSSGFGNANNLVDHIQYSFNGMDIPSATPRSGPAVTAELWIAANDWITVDTDSAGMVLTADPFPGPGNAHGSASYDVLTPPPAIVSADSVDIGPGVLLNGSVADLDDSDNVDLSVSRNPFGLQAVVQLDLNTVSPTDMPSSLEFQWESSIFARGNATQTISLFNYDTGSFEQLDTRNASRFGDSTVTVTPSGDVSRFVEPGTGNMEARIRYSSGVARLQFTVNADQAFWTVGN